MSRESAFLHSVRLLLPDRAAGRNDDPLLFVKVLHRQLVGMAHTNALAVERLFSAMNYLASFAKNPLSGVVADDIDLFCKLQAELLRCNSAVTSYGNMCE